MARTTTYLNNLDEQKVEELLKDTTDNVAYLQNSVSKIVDDYSHDLDDLMQHLYAVVTGDEIPDTIVIERYYADLTGVVYFMAGRVEKLNIYSDMAKAAAKEVYNKAYLASSVQKDEKGKSKTTVAENTAVAESESQYEMVVSQIYEHAYKILKTKVDAANEMISTLKNILKRRMNEDYFSAQVKSIME